MSTEETQWVDYVKEGTLEPKPPGGLVVLAMVISFVWFSILYCVGLMPDQEITAKTAKNEIVLVCDDLDYAAIQQSMARRQAYRVTPDSGSNVAGATVAEICRGWYETLTTDVDDNGFD